MHLDLYRLNAGERVHVFEGRSQVVGLCLGLACSTFHAGLLIDWLERLVALHGCLFGSVLIN